VHTAVVGATLLQCEHRTSWFRATKCSCLPGPPQDALRKCRKLSSALRFRLPSWTRLGVVRASLMVLNIRAGYRLPSVTIEALFVPESTRVETLLKTFQAEQRHLAVVVDEFGGVEGIATLEDVIEEVFGDIEDESDEPVARLWQRPDGSLEVRAGTELRRVCAALNLEWLPELEVTSLGGLITERLGRIPVVGETLDWRGHRLEVLAADSRRPRLVRITPGADRIPVEDQSQM
jgi:CBS domain containing-hemolysin-like protein